MTPMLFAANDASSPAVKAFVDTYHKAYGKEPNFAAQMSYTGAQIAVLALKNAGPNLTPDSFVAGLESIKDFHDIFGSPVIPFSAIRHQGSNQSFLCLAKDGHWQAAEAQPLGY